MALIEKLEAIGDAIRAKTGGTELLTLDEMPTEIAAIETGGGGEYFTDEELIFEGNCSGIFASNHWNRVIENEKGRIKIQNPTYLNSMLEGSTGEDYSHIEIVGNPSISVYFSSLFQGCEYIKKLPKISSVTINSNQQGYYFYKCYRLTDVNEIIQFFQGITFSLNAPQVNYWFASCYSLRNIDAAMPYIKEAFTKKNTNMFRYNYMFNNCCSLDEINNVPVITTGSYSYDNFGSTFGSLCRAKNITFETNNGEPLVTSMAGSTIDLSTNIGYAPSTTYQNYILNYDSGITVDKLVNSEETYEALKNDADWYATGVLYSRYNHDSAVNTINSLPDTSAYVASTGKTNTIKFKGTSGQKTDGGAISTLTTEEIAVATAKGWTVTLV